MGQTFIIFGLPFVILSIFGNLFTIITVLKTRSLRSRNSIRFTTNLAFCDLLFSILNCPVNVVTDLLDLKEINSTLCRVNGFLGILFCMASIFTLSSLSFDRYFAIVKPYRYNSFMTFARVKLIIISSWIFPAILASVPLPGWGDYVFWPQKGFCFIDYNKDIGVFFFVGIWFYVGVMVIVFSYYHIFKVARRQRKQIQSLNVGSALDKEDILSEICCRNRLKNTKQENKAAFTIFIIIGSFFLCWMPFAIVNMTSALMKYRIPNSVDVITTILVAISSCVNPFIYGLLDLSFRSAFRRIISRVLLLPRQVIGKRAPAVVVLSRKLSQNKSRVSIMF